MALGRHHTPMPTGGGIHPISSIWVYVSDGSEDGTNGLPENGIDELQSLPADIRTWDGGIRQFLIGAQLVPTMIDRVMADAMKHVL